MRNLRNGNSFEHRFDQPGVVSYLCGPHPEMTGTVEIRTGQRSVLGFLLRPMLKSQEALRER